MTDSNIDRFNELAARILADLYRAFPLPRNLTCADYNITPVLNEQDQLDDASQFFMATVRWLSASGYLRYDHENCVLVWDAVLTPKGLEALCTVPEALAGQPPLGERLNTAAIEGSKTLLAETVKAVLAAGAARWFGG